MTAMESSSLHIRGVKAFVFDMDGTILHTFPDLAATANEAFEAMGFPTRTSDEIMAHMGFGGRWMIWQLVPQHATDEQRERTFAIWRDRYINSGYPLTRPFPGIVDVVRELRARGVKTAVLSNKFDEGARVLAERHFPGLFDVVRGDSPSFPRKPDPESLLQMLEEMGVSPAEAAYVGDAAIDVETARNAGVYAVGVSWGYGKANPLPLDELDAYVTSPEQLLG